MLRTSVLPHILMRFYTVPDAKTARGSVVYATGFIGSFYLVTFILGFGASVIVGRAGIAAVDKGENMAAPMLANAFGDTAFLGFISAVAFATIVAVVAGLTLSGAASLTHDLWNNVFRGGKATEKEKLRAAKLATLGLGVVAIFLGVVFKGQNVAFMVGLAFAIAASGNFPVLVLSMLWKPFTTKGAVAAMLAGTLSSVVLIFLSPTVQVDVLHHVHGVIDLKNPGIFTVPIGFAFGIIVSLVSPEKVAQDRYAETERRIELGRDVSLDVK